MDYKGMSNRAVLTEIGERISRCRLNQNVTQVALARLSGVTRIVVQRLENGLGCRLLFRVGSHLELTEAGEALAPALTAGFARIMEAVGNVRREQRKQQLA